MFIMSWDTSFQSSVSERITPSADSKFDPSFQVFFCDDIEELNEAYFRDFTVNHCSCIMVYFHRIIKFSLAIAISRVCERKYFLQKGFLWLSLHLHLSLHILDWLETRFTDLDYTLSTSVYLLKFYNSECIWLKKGLGSAFVVLVAASCVKCITTYSVFYVGVMVNNVESWISQSFHCGSYT